MIIGALVGWLLVMLDADPSARRAQRGPQREPIAQRGASLARPASHRIAASPAISGRVVSRSQVAISGAKVCAGCADCYAMAAPPAPVCAQTDAHGNYVLRDLYEGEYRIVASAEGYEPGALRDGRPLSLRAADLSEQNIQLSTGGSRLAGVVFDATGGPVARATVMARFAGVGLPLGRKLEQSVESDDSGAFVLDARRGEVELIAMADGYAPAATVRHAPSHDVALVLTPASRIAGVVVSAADKTLVPGVRVNAFGDEGGDTAISDFEGRFVLAALRPGSYRLEALGDGWIGRGMGEVRVDVGETKNDVVVPVQLGVRVTGTIRSGDTPCAAGTAYLRPAPGAPLPELLAHTDVNGRVVFAAVPAGRYESSASCLEHGHARGDAIDVGAHDLDGLSWTIAAGAELLVHVRTPSGEPVPRAWIRLGDPDDGSPEAMAATRVARTDERGDVRFFAVPAGGHSVYTTGTITRRLAFEVAEGRTNELTFTLDGLGAIEVVVRDRDGRPNDNVAVAAQSREAPGGIAEARGEGRYYIGALDAGDYRVAIGDSTNPLVEAGAPGSVVRVRSGETTSLEVSYGGYGGTVAGRVVDALGAPVANAWVSAQPSARGEGAFDVASFGLSNVSRARRLTGPDGAFELEGLLETGSYALTATHGSGARAQLDDARAGQRVTLTLGEPELSALTAVDPPTQQKEEP